MLIDVLPILRLPRSVGPLTYRIQDTHSGTAPKPGTWVSVPFRRRTVDALVYRWNPAAMIPASKIRDIAEVLSIPALTARQLRCAEFVAQTYAVSLSHALYSFLPSRPKRTVKQASADLSQRTERCTIGASGQKALDAMLDESMHGQATTVFLPTATRSESIALWLLAATRIADGQMLLIVPTVFRLRELAAALTKRFSDRTVVLDPDDGVSAYWTAWQSAGTRPHAILLTTKRGLMAPASNLRYVCLDTETDPSHRQSGQNPRYHARAVAAFLAQLHGARLLTTDAVPSLALAQHHGVHIFPSPRERRARLVVNLSHERASGNFSPLADRMVAHLRAHHGPALLFLNRKGSARILRCLDCSWSFVCPTCGASLVLHASGHYACHRCRTQTTAQLVCPACHGTSLKSSGIGCEQVEHFCKTAFPDRATTRIDAESFDVKERPDLVVATEKILTVSNLPEFSTIIFVALDQLFHQPDYRAQEHALQLSERVIQLSLPTATVAFQTYNPDHDVVRALERHAYETLYTPELAIRRQLLLPPAAHIVLLRGKGKPDALREEAAALTKKFHSACLSKDFRIEGPLLGKNQSIGMIVRLLPGHGQLATLQRFLQTLPDHWLLDPDPESLLL